MFSTTALFVSDTYFKLVAFFLIFNVLDLIGRTLAGIVQWVSE